MRMLSPLFAILVLIPRVFSASPELPDAKKAYQNGDYAKAAQVSRKAIEENQFDEEWPIMLVQSLKAKGDYTNAVEAASVGIRKYYRSLRLRLEAYDAFKLVGNKEKALEMLSDINQLGTSRGYRDAADVVALGRGALLLGIDPRVVLENFFDAAKKLDPKYPGTYVAAGTLALDKHDDALAAKTFQEGLKAAPEDQDLLFGLARAYASSDPRQMGELLDKVLDLNKNHVPALLLLTDHSIDAEAYEQAKEMIDRVLAIHPDHPEALAYRGVISHLHNKPEEESAARTAALKKSPANPRVDYLLGLKLSQKYRFAEGAQYQRHALALDADYLPSQIQLAQDLLRLGGEEEGWSLAEKVHAADAYDTYAYNLVTLKETITGFATITNSHFMVRMSAREKEVYGHRVLNLLERAEKSLCEKYGLSLTNPVLVEIFPDQKDFAVRTFGMPGGSGYLGVCFGNVITANSPAAQVGTPSNWEAMLWHEFCHVVTLHLTRNRMPRWLSEGISVYEEIQSDPVWGQHMDPTYRQMILKGELKPIGKLSGAFLNPKSGQHLQFAYYESSLVVRFLAERYGFGKLRGILKDLGDGMLINPALEKNTVPLSELESEFEKFATDLAKKMGTDLEWEKPKPDPTWKALHGDNYWVLLEKAGKLVTQTNWAEAKPILQKLIAMYPGQRADGNAYELLARIHRAEKNKDAEKAVLESLVAKDADATEALERLMVFDLEEKNWKALGEHAARFLAVNPLVVKPHQNAARAFAETARRDEAIQEYRVVLAMDPPDPADAHFSLAKLLYDKNDPEARKQVLEALEAAPRFRQAHELLRKLGKSKAAGDTTF